jgi:hypothetical protein
MLSLPIEHIKNFLLDYGAAAEAQNDSDVGADIAETMRTAEAADRLSLTAGGLTHL